MSATLFRRLIGQAKTRETRKIWWLKIQLAESSHVEGQVGLDPIRVAHGIQNRQAHVGYRDLREEAAVNVFHKRMHGGLRMYGDLNRRWRKIEEAARLDNFQALVEHGGGINRDAPSH